MCHPRTLVLLFGLGAACALPADWDGDGYPATADCDDLDPSLHPDAEEIAGDGIDQDCVGGDLVQRVQGEEHDCLLSVDGHVECEGSNDHGQLDLPETSDDDRWVQLAAGAYHTCALSALGEVSCWGDDTWGQSSPPARRQFVSIAAGDYSSTGDTPSRDGFPGQTLCWGRCFVVP